MEEETKVTEELTDGNLNIQDDSSIMQPEILLYDLLGNVIENKLEFKKQSLNKQKQIITEQLSLEQLFQIGNGFDFIQKIVEESIEYAEKERLLDLTDPNNMLKFGDVFFDLYFERYDKELDDVIDKCINESLEYVKNFKE